MITLAAITIASFSRYMRSSMMEALTEDYVRTARAKGRAPAGPLRARPAQRPDPDHHPARPVAPGHRRAAPLITETVFNYPGMGLAHRTTRPYNTDIPLLLGTTLVATVATVVGSLLADILYAVVDPRIRYV